MSFPRYSEYKDTGEEWMGEVPAHWEVLPLSRLTLAKCDGPFGSGLKSDHYTDSGVRVIRLQNIRQGDFDGSNQTFIEESYFANELSRHAVRENDLLIAGLGDETNTVGRACVAPIGIAPAIVKADCFRFRLDQSKALPQFVAMQLTAGSESDAARLASGSTRSRIPLSVMSSRRVTLPPLCEQKVIVLALAKELGKLDSLLADQRRLIELLREKRQAVISHAVTKGLDPQAPMKASGVEWLGEVPAHWKVAPLRRFEVTVQTGPFGSQLHAEEYCAEGTPVINPVNLVRGGIVPNDEVRVPDVVVERLAHQRLMRGDILFARRGELGRCALVGEAEEGWLCGTGCMIVRLNHVNYRAAYLARYLAIESLQRYLESFSVGAIMDNLSATTVLDMPLLVPPVAEQESIERALREKTMELDELMHEVNRASELLQERRTALISAAVTGKIDVRDLADAEAA